MIDDAGLQRRAKQALHEEAEARRETVGTGAAATAARRLEIFLDVVAHEANDDASFLLDERYRALLGDDEVALADSLESVDPRGFGSAARSVRELLARLGRREPSQPAARKSS